MASQICTWSFICWNNWRLLSCWTSLFRYTFRVQYYIFKFKSLYQKGRIQLTFFYGDTANILCFLHNFQNVAASFCFMEIIPWNSYNLACFKFIEKNMCYCFQFVVYYAYFTQFLLVYFDFEGLSKTFRLYEKQKRRRKLLLKD